MSGYLQAWFAKRQAPTQRPRRPMPPLSDCTWPGRAQLGRRRARRSSRLEENEAPEDLDEFEDLDEPQDLTRVETFPPRGAFAASPASGEQVELPITFSTGGKLLEVNFPAGTSASAAQPWSGQTTPYTFLDVQIVGLKVVGWLRASLLGVGTTGVGTTTAYTPPLLALTDPHAQCAVIANSMRADGGLDLYPDEQVLNLGGPFGASSERIFDGIRMQDMVWRNGRIDVKGLIQAAFDLPALPEAAFDVSLRAAVIAVIKRDYRLHPERL